MTAQVAIKTEIGTECRCRCCGEFWPADPDFFPKSSRTASGLDNICHDCNRQQATLRQQRYRNQICRQPVPRLTDALQTFLTGQNSKANPGFFLHA